MPSPSQTAASVGLALLSLGAGYYLGSKSAQAKAAAPPPGTQDVKTETKEVAEQVQEEEDSDVDDPTDGDLTAVAPKRNEACKLVLVVRTDLKMTTGKMCAQCGHATLACYKALEKKNPKLLHQWERWGQAKIALRVSSQEELLELAAIAKSLNLCARIVEDAGRTQVLQGARTVLGIGPGPISVIDEVTRHLKLL